MKSDFAVEKKKKRKRKKEKKNSKQATKVGC